MENETPSPAPHVTGDQHPDEIAVDRFFAAMKAKLAKKRDDGRGGWENKAECSAEFLSQLLREHVEKGDPIDVANFCMMLHQRGERISPSSETNLVGPDAAADLLDTLLSAADMWTDYGSGFRIHFSFSAGSNADLVRRLNERRAALATSEVKP